MNSVVGEALGDLRSSILVLLDADELRSAGLAAAV